jgi:formate dehydrogenase subunit delta
MSESDAKLVTMANQIGRFFAPQREADKVGAIAGHLRKFWDPRMRAAIVAHLEKGGAGLDEPVRRAVRRLKETEAQKRQATDALPDAKGPSG